MKLETIIPTLIERFHARPEPEKRRIAEDHFFYPLRAAPSVDDERFEHYVLHARECIQCQTDAVMTYVQTRADEIGVLAYYLEMRDE
jgi:hypothetical protein